MENSNCRERPATRQSLGPGKTSSLRSRSLSRKPCKAIADMAEYFLEEATLSQTGRAGRPRSASPECGYVRLHL